MLSIGSLNRRVVIQARTGAVDSYGQPVEDWAPHATVWAAVIVPTGTRIARERIEAGGITADASPVTIRIRYKTDITAAMRVVDGVTVYNIQEVLPNVATKVFTDLRCEVDRG